jgi:putative protease
MPASGQLPRERPELLAPAGTPAKLRTALHFGADAVYLGLKRYGLRSGAGNFTEEQLEWALHYAHERDARVYVTLNIQPFDEDFAGIERALQLLARMGADAVIVADAGVHALSQQVAPTLAVHLSTQLSITNVLGANWWFDGGIERIICARELSLEQLATLCAGARGELEAFVHGAVCVAWSGRCLLSLYWADRDSRRGHCAGACRWRFKGLLIDRRHPEAPNPVEQDERGTYFFDAKDLCALPVLDRVVETGLRALKIEGRTRSEHYVGATVDVYRHALDRLAAGDLEGFAADKQRYLDELARPAYRAFSTHFLTGEQDRAENYLPRGAFSDGRVDFVGRVVEATAAGLVLEVVNAIRPGVELEVRDRGLRCEPVKLQRLTDEAGAPLEIAETGQRVLLPGRFEAGPEALVRLARPD